MSRTRLGQLRQDRLRPFAGRGIEAWAVGGCRHWFGNGATWSLPWLPSDAGRATPPGWPRICSAPHRDRPPPTARLGVGPPPPGRRASEVRLSLQLALKIEDVVTAGSAAIPAEPGGSPEAPGGKARP